MGKMYEEFVITIVHGMEYFFKILDYLSFIFSLLPYFEVYLGLYSEFILNLKVLKFSKVTMSLESAQ